LVEVCAIAFGNELITARQRTPQSGMAFMSKMFNWR
jgi:hypothetical protein